MTTIREPFGVKDEAFYEEAYAFYDEWLREDLDELRNTDDKQVIQSTWKGLFNRKIKILNIRYSRGDDLAAIRADLPDMLETYLKADEACMVAWGTHLWKPDVLHEEELILLGFCYCLGVDDEALLQRFLSCFVPEGKSTLADRLVAVRQPGRKIGDPKKWNLAQTYRFLNDAIDAPPEQQAKLIKKYLKRYEYNLKGPKRDQVLQNLKKSETYVGDWAYDVAAVVCAFGIDDSGFIDHPHYPRDLVHYRDGCGRSSA